MTNFNNFKKQYGGFLSEFSYGGNRFLANSVEQFFANGGTRCYVSRVIPEDAKAASKKAGILSVTAKNQGAWGNRIQVSMACVTKKKMQLVSKQDAGYVAKSVDGFREGDIVVSGTEYNRIATIFDNVVTFETPFKSNVVDTAIVPKTLLYLVEADMSIRFNDDAENYSGLSFNVKSPSYICTRLAVSEMVTVAAEQIKTLMNPAEAILGKGKFDGMFTLEGGTDGNISKVTAATFIGTDNGPGKRTGIASFVENNLISMIAVPGVTIPEVVVALTTHCETMKNRVAVIDMPGDAYKTEDLIKYRNMIDSTYAAMYHPWIQVFDRSTNAPGFIPPSGAVMGVYSRTDINRGVHKAPANEAVFCTGLKVGYTAAEQDVLNPEGINLIRELPGQGIRIWGARTASTNSAFKYINVRRLFIFVEESIKANTNWVVFEPNDTTLWSRVSLTISSFLDTLWRNGMLSGASAAEAYFVEIGPNTMTRDDIMNGRLICNVGIAPSRPAEFVIFRVTQHTAEAGGAEAGGEEAAT